MIILSGPRWTWICSSAAILLFIISSRPNLAAIDLSPLGLTPEQIAMVLEHRVTQGLPPRDPSNHYCDDPKAAQFGKQVFFSDSYSIGEKMSCASCHDPKLGLADGKKTAVGADGTVGDRNSPGLWNVGFNRWFFWDGRADCLWVQALEPIENVHELCSSRNKICHVVAENAPLRKSYEDVFGQLPDISSYDRFPENARPPFQGVSDDASHKWDRMSEEDKHTINDMYVKIGKSLEAYERGFISRKSRFDEFADGVAEKDSEKLKALDAEEIEGLKIFTSKGNCELCHSGPNFTDYEFHSTRLPATKGSEPGRFHGIQVLQEREFSASKPLSDDIAYGITHSQGLVKSAQQFGQFKTPSLRNVQLTAPYMHTGQFGNLDQVVSFYSDLKGATPSSHDSEQLLVPLNLSASEQHALVAFLKSLTDLNSKPQ